MNIIIKHLLWVTEDSETEKFKHGTTQVKYEVISEDATSYLVNRENRDFKEVVYKDPEAKKENRMHYINHKPFTRRLLDIEVWLPEGEDVTPYFEEALSKKMEDLLNAEERLKKKKKGVSTALKELGGNLGN